MAKSMRRQLVKMQPTAPKPTGSARTNRLVQRPISGLNSRGKMHRVAYLADGSLDKRTLCGAWAAQSPATAELADCPVCLQIMSESRLVPVIDS